MKHLISSNPLSFVLSSILLPALALSAAGATRYVNIDNSTPSTPYTSWLTAATSIQQAVDVAAAEDEIVVADGRYATGGRALYGIMTNRVVIDKAVVVRSVNGPLKTVIEGCGAPGNVNGDGAIRCVYVGTNAVLSGFTLTNGHTRAVGHDTMERSGGGAWCELSGMVTNCALTGNSAYYYGGGAYNGTLNNCTLSGNSASFNGGGANGATLNDCILSSNWVPFLGGGVASCVLRNCILINNSGSKFGGGAYDSRLQNCALNGNSASEGGGAYQCTLNNCTLTANSAVDSGGGVIYGTLNNCTLTGNSAIYGGGADSSVLNNCIAYYNVAPNGPNHKGSTFDYSCTTPLPMGTGNLGIEPLLASTSHLSAESPCIGRGSSTYSSGVDIDGESWLNPPCIGADQFIAGQTTGGLAMAFTASYTNVASGFAVAFIAQTTGRLVASVWDFGDGVVVSNRPYISHAWSVPGFYEVRLTGYNETLPGGVSARQRVLVANRHVYYVDAANGAPLFPYTNRADAATNIQEAIDAGVQIGRLVLVADGVYGTGGRAVYGQMTNRVVVSQGVEVRSVNGPLVTQIEGASVGGTANGDGAIRCVYVSTNAVLSGFTLTNGHTRMAGNEDHEQSGGGLWCESSGVVNNCVLTANSAKRSAGAAYGGTLNDCDLSSNWAGTPGTGRAGGAYNAALNNCTLTANSAGWGGGAYGGTLDNCTLSGNLAYTAGGACNSTLNNCILSGNVASFGGGGASGGTLNNCTFTANSAITYGGGAHESTLNDCTLNGNSSNNQGGGANGSTLNNCVLSGNWSYFGGGAFAGTLNNCTLTGNLAANAGGGLYGGTLNNCTVSGNSASGTGGGASSGTLNNCIVYYNDAADGSNYYSCNLNYSCAAPLPTNGIGNIATAPRFADAGGLSSLRLLPNSPCINAGNNAFLTNSYLSNSLDLDGQPRIVSGTVDMGAYEFQGSGSLISYAWLQQYGLRTDGSVDLADGDHDGMNNWQEWRAGTSPLQAASALRIVSVAPAAKGWMVSWQSVGGIAYFLERSTNLAVTVFSIVQSNIPGQADTTAYTDTNAVGLDSLFYRVGVR